MAKVKILAGTTSKIVRVFVQDSRSGSGAGLTGLVFNTVSLTCYYIREGAATPGIAVSLITATVGTWVSGGFIAVDATNMPGLYELSLPNAVLAAGAQSVVVMLQGAANMVPVLIEIELDAVNYQSSANFVASVPSVVAGVTLSAADASVVSILGLLGKNQGIRNQTYDSSNNLLSADLCAYDSPAHATTNDGVTGLLHKDSLINTYTGGQLTSQVIQRIS